MERFRKCCIGALVLWAACVLFLPVQAEARVTLSVDFRFEVLRTASFTLDDWENYPNLWCVIITPDPITERIEYAYIHFEIRSDRFSKIAWGNTEMFTVDGVTVKCNTDFTDLYDGDTNDEFEDEVKRVLKLPDDTYYLIFELWDGGDDPYANRYTQGEKVETYRESVEITNPNTPILVSPSDGGTTSLFPTFQWQLPDIRDVIAGEDPLQITYTLRVYRMFDDQGAPLSEEDAVLFNPIFEAEVINGNSVVFDPGEAAEELLPGRKYAWKVWATDEIGRAVGDERGTETFWFTPQFAPAQLLSPIGGSEIGVLPPTFTWTEAQASGMQLFYDFVIATDPGYSDAQRKDGIVGGVYRYDGPSLVPGILHYWKLQTVDGLGRALGDPLEETFRMPPLQIIYPVDETVATLIPNFVWRPYGDIESYQVTVLDAEGEEMWSREVYEAQVRYDGEALSYGTTYTWRLQARSRGATAGTAQEVPFITPGAEEVHVTLRSPVDVVVSDLTPRLEWELLKGANEYAVTVFDEEGTAMFSTSIRATTVRLGASAGLEYNSTYRWKVQADIGRASEWATFYTPQEEGAPEEVTDISFIWDPIEGAVRYRFVLSPNEDMSDPMWTTESAKALLFYPSAAPPLEQGKTYYWTVEGLDAEGGAVGTTRGTFTSTGAPGEFETSLEELDRAIKAVLPDPTELGGFTLASVKVNGSEVTPDDVIELLKSFRMVSVRIE